MKKPRISIIGLGRVGTAFLNIFTSHNFEVISVFNRSKVPESLAAKFPETSFHTGLPKDANELGELTFLTLSDDAIQPLAEELSRNMSALIGKFFVHCSGTKSSEVLQPLRDQGGQVASFHPMKAITPQTTHFEGTWFDLEGDEAVLSLLENIADQIGSHAFRVEPEDKERLHISAVVASNYLVALADLASSISAQGNIPKDTLVKALSSLMQNTLDNINGLGVDEALTGPIIRGDVETVRDHIQKLHTNSGALDLYKKLGKQALDITKRKEKLTPNHLDIEKLLKS